MGEVDGQVTVVLLTFKIRFIGYFVLFITLFEEDEFTVSVLNLT